MRTLSVTASAIAAACVVAAVPTAGQALTAAGRTPTAGDAPTAESTATAVMAEQEGRARTVKPRGWIRQVGTYAYLTAPDYTGLAPIATAAEGATLGLGTFDRLSGELMLVDGHVYRVGVKGVAERVPQTRLTPFLQAVAFRPQVSLRVPAGTPCTDFPGIIDRATRSQAGALAVRAEGVFRQLTARSVPAQRTPYPPLSDVVAEQTVFPLDGSAATLVGFMLGSDVAGTGAPGLHLHGLTADRDAGGHILSCVTGRGVRLQIQVTEGVRVFARP